MLRWRCSCWCSRRARVLVYFRVPPASRARPHAAGAKERGSAGWGRVRDFPTSALQVQRNGCVCTT